MSTVDKAVADRIVAGEFTEDNATRIVEYDNAFGGISYGVTFGDEPKGKYLEPTPFVQNPRIYWDAETAAIQAEIDAKFAEVRLAHGENAEQFVRVIVESMRNAHVLTSLFKAGEPPPHICETFKEVLAAQCVVASSLAGELFKIEDAQHEPLMDIGRELFYTSLAEIKKEA